VQPGAIQRRVQVAADEVVGRGIAQIDRDACDAIKPAEIRMARIASQRMVDAFMAQAPILRARRQQARSLARKRQPA
jgi:hypothetical protein